MALRVTLVQGGGVGLDQAPAVKRILQAAGVDIQWDEHFAGNAAVEQGQPALSPGLLESVRRNGLALKTKLLVAPHKQGNYNVQFRRALGLFASVRPLKNLKGTARTLRQRGHSRRPRTNRRSLHLNRT